MNGKGYFNKKYKPCKNATDKICEIMELKKKEVGNIVTDPNGSYTGVPQDMYEVPVQDVDDL